jgi:predicted metalloprotease with PDZ domain
MRSFKFLRSTVQAFLIALMASVAYASSHDFSQKVNGNSTETILLKVDATDVNHRLLNVSETIPVSNSGPLTLYFPKWIPGTHAPSGPIHDLAGLILYGSGKRIEWRRDPIDMNAFHVDVPVGVHQLDVTFQMLCSEATPSAMTGQLVAIEWNTVSLYPKGLPVRQLSVSASLRLLDGWNYATALQAVQESHSAVTFETVSYDKLVDSPLIAGANFKQIELSRQGDVAIRLNIAADRKSDLDIQQFQIGALKNLTLQAEKLFKSHHFDHYDFLLTISDQLKFRGLEHHQSSEDGIANGLFSDWDKGGSIDGQLMPHEFVHSWNGKYRRPLDLSTPDYETPMQNSLLWVYEGLTEYWGDVLTARSGLQSSENVKEDLALWAAILADQKGRAWRDLKDTTNGEILSGGRQLKSKWYTWQRGMDYYGEGAFIWLDIDAIIRTRSRGARSLDDLASRFFGEHAKEKAVPLTYDFDDLVEALNQIEPFDWREYLTARLNSHGDAPLDGLAKSGYRLVFTDKNSDFRQKEMKSTEEDDFFFSLGFVTGKDGKFTDVSWDSPAFAVGLARDMTLVAVNNEPYSEKVLNEAIVNATQGGEIELIVRAFDKYRTVSINYRGGLRYPHLEKISKTPLLDKILSPR